MYNACMQNYRMYDCRNSQHVKNHWTCDLLKKSQLIGHGLSLPYLVFMGLLFSRDGERQSLCNKRHHLPEVRVNIQREIADENTDISPVREVGIEVIESELKYRGLGLRRC